MSSSYHSNHQEHTFCPSCGKRKTIEPKPVAKPVEENTNFGNFDFSSLMADPQTMKSLFLFLLTLFNKFESEKKEPKTPHHECKCKDHHNKEKYDWWKHDNKHDDSSSKHECKCKCKNNTKKGHDWWKHDDKHDESPSKHECDCMKKEPEKKYRHFELEPDFSKVSKQYEDFLTDFSSSFESEFNHFKKEQNKHENYKNYEHKNFHFDLDSSSSEDMQQQYHHKNKPEMPDKIWLADVLSLLYKYNLLNLDNLFDQLNKNNHNHHQNKPTCNCNKGKKWGDSYNHKNDNYEYTKEYYYKGMPLKKIKRKADPYKKFK